MSIYPKWLLAMVFPCLLSLLTCPFYLFGHLELLGTSDSALLRFLLYFAQNALWVLPVASFFTTLRLYDPRRLWPCLASGVAGLALTALSIALILI